MTQRKNNWYQNICNC